MNRVIRIIICLGLALQSVPGQAQSWLWARTAGGTPNEESRCVRNDPDGNVLISGAFRTTLMAIGTLSVTNRSTVGTSDALVVKYDAQGNELWAVSMGGTNNDVARAIDCDGSGNVYVTGYFRSTVFYCGNDTLFNTGLTAADFFVAKIDPNGNIVWVRKLQGTGNDYGNSIDVDSVGNAYISGYFTSDTLVVGPDTLLNPAPSVYDALMLKVDSAGNFIWGRSLAGTGDDEGQGVSIGANHSIFFSGFFASDSVFINNQSISNPAPGFDQVFVLSLSDSGQFQWIREFGGSEHDRSFAITTDAEGRLYATGRFGSPSFSFGTFTFTNTSTVFTPDIFVVRMDPANGNPIWAQQAGGLLDDLGEGIACDAKGNVIVTGRFTSDQLVFGVQTLVNAATPNSDIFMVEYDSLGGVRWSYREGEVLNEYGQSVCVFDSTVYLTGFYRDSVLQLNPFTLVNGFSGNQDLFVAAFYQPGALPASLLSFQATPRSGQVQVSWVTALENHSDYFLLDRSIDGLMFQPLARVRAAGFSTTIRKYDYFDDKPLFGGMYYRLCLTDMNGRKTYFKPVYVEMQDHNSSEVHMNLTYNAPFLAIEIEGFTGAFRFRIFDASGREVLNTEEQCESITCNRMIQTGIQTKGIYLCVLETDSGILARQRFSVR